MLAPVPVPQILSDPEQRENYNYFVEHPEQVRLGPQGSQGENEREIKPGVRLVWGAPPWLP